MSTDTVLVPNSIASAFLGALLQAVEDSKKMPQINSLISNKSATRIKSLVEDATSKGAKSISLLNGNSKIEAEADTEEIRGTAIPATVIEGLDASMRLYSEESFGPLL